MPPRALPGAMPLETRVRAGMKSRDPLFGGVRVGGIPMEGIGRGPCRLLPCRTFARRGISPGMTTARAEVAAKPPRRPPLKGSDIP